jgi:hypothetical protein
MNNWILDGDKCQCKDLLLFSNIKDISICTHAKFNLVFFIIEKCLLIKLLDDEKSFRGIWINQDLSKN